MDVLPGRPDTTQPTTHRRGPLCRSAEEKVSIRQIGQAVLASGEKGQALTVERQEAQALLGRV